MSEVLFPVLWAIGLLVFVGILAGRARILLAEDNELNADIIRTLLADYGITTDTAQDGRKGPRTSPRPGHRRRSP